MFSTTTNERGDLLSYCRFDGVREDVGFGRVARDIVENRLKYREVEVNGSWREVIFVGMILDSEFVLGSEKLAVTVLSLSLEYLTDWSFDSVGEGTVGERTIRFDLRVILELLRVEFGRLKT
jgi:hypothetical protein